MFRNHNEQPIVDEEHFAESRNVQLALEVISGQSVSILRINFNTNKGNVRIGSSTFELEFEREDETTLRIRYGDWWCTATFLEDGKVKAVHEERPGFEDLERITWEGYSIVHREKVSSAD